MHITSIKMEKTEDNARQLADVSIVIDDELLIKNIKLINNGKRLFVAFPQSKKKPLGENEPDVIPLYPYVRDYIEEQIINEYLQRSEQWGKEREEE